VADRVDTLLERGASGVARRTASGGRGGDGLVMSGKSSEIAAPNSGRSSDAGAGARSPATRCRRSRLTLPEK